MITVYVPTYVTGELFTSVLRWVNSHWGQCRWKNNRTLLEFYDESDAIMFKLKFGI